MKKIITLKHYFVLVLIFGTIGIGNSQSIEKLKVSANYQDKPLKLVLFDYEIGYKLKFDYEEELIEGISVTSFFNKKTLEQGLSKILYGTGLGFEILENKQIAIRPLDELKPAIVENTSQQPTQFNFSIKGTIKAQDTGESLPFATVLVQGANVGTSSNVDGYFTLLNVPSDTAILQIQYIGYQTKKIRLNPNLDMDNLLIELSDFSQSLREVTVTAEQEEQLIKASTGISRIGLSPAVISKLPSFGEKDIFRSLQLLPGVSGSNESSSGLYVRGGTPDQNLVLFDGFTVYHVDHLFGFFSAFNPNAIKDVQLYKGGFEAKYGGRLSSVVELTGKDGNTEEFNVGVGLSLISANAFVEFPFDEGKGSVLLAARRSFQSGFYNNLFSSFTEGNQNANTPDLPQGGFGGRGFGQQEVQPNSYFYDLNAKTTYRLGKKDIFSISFYNGEDDLDNSRNADQNAFGGRGAFGGGENNVTFQSNNTDLTNWGNWGTSVKWSRRWNDQFYSNLNLSYSNYFSERDRRNETTISRGDTTINRTNGSYEYNDLRDITLKFDNELKLSYQNQLEFGIQSTYNDIKYEFTQNDTLSILNRANTGTTTALYIQDQHTINDQLILKGGIRSLYYDVTNKIYIEPRASLTYLLNDRLKLKAAWGQYHQFASRIIREDIQQGSRDFWLLADDENVPIGYAEHFIAGMSYETPKYLFDVEGYYKNLDGLSEYTTRFTPSGRGPNRSLNYDEFFYQGTGVAKGIEFLVQKKSGALTGWLGYTLGEVKYDFEVFGDEPFFANQDQTHELKLILSYQLKNWNFGSTFIYATGRPYTAPTGYYEIELLDGNSASFFEVSDKNALRFQDYHRLDLSVTNDFRLGTSKASIGLSIFNLYNRNNTWYKEYEVIEGELLETDVSLLNFTPSLFFTWSLR